MPVIIDQFEVIPAGDRPSSTSAASTSGAESAVSDAELAATVAAVLRDAAERAERVRAS